MLGAGSQGRPNRALEVLLVRRLDGFDHAYDARHDVIGPRRVRVSVDGRGPTRSRVYDVKPWVYF